MINPKEFTSLRREFNKIDTNGSGTIEIEELKAAVRKCHSSMSDEDLKKIIEEVDIQGTGIIHYHEFIAAIFPVEKYATKERLQSLFSHFDTTQSHTISGTTLKDAFTKLGHKLTEEEVH